MPQITVIIPVYNAEQYLEGCLESIVSQSFCDWECICVNDGSSDSSVEILEAYASKDKRIIVLTQNNAGPAIARSKGLECATGKYLLFQDADDFIEEHAYGRLLELMEKTQVDVLGFSYETCPDRQLSRFSMKCGEVLPPTALLKSTKKPQASDDFSFIWRYMIRRSLLLEHSVTFDSRIRVGEDTLFMMEVFSHASSIFLTDYAPYHYRVDNQNSIMHEVKYKPYLEESLSVLYEKKMRIIQKNAWDELTPFSFDLACRAVNNYSRMLMNNRKSKGEPKENYIPEVLHMPMIQDAMNIIGFKNVYGSWKEYMVYLCMKFCFMPVLKHYF
jgi:glycosyltransferase EpsJ